MLDTEKSAQLRKALVHFRRFGQIRYFPDEVLEEVEIRLPSEVFRQVWYELDLRKIIPEKIPPKEMLFFGFRVMDKDRIGENNNL